MRIINTLKSPLTVLRAHKISLIAATALCILFALGSAWYFLYHTKKPEYSLNQIRTAIENHDVDTFNNHVDLPAILASGYDDLIDIMLESDNNMSPDAKKMVLDFSKFLKDPVVAAFAEGINRYIKFGTWEDEKNSNSQMKNRAIPDIHPEKIADKTSLQNTTYLGISAIQKNGDRATVGMRIYETELQQEFVLDLQMAQLADGSWQVTEISNTRDYLTAIATAKQQVLRDYLNATKEIVTSRQTNIEHLQTQFSVLSADLANKNNKALQEFLQNKMLPEWQAYKADLEQITVPNAATEVSILRTKMIDLQQQYVEKQIEALNQQNPALEVTLKTLKTLKQQATELNYRMQNIINQVTADKK